MKLLFKQRFFSWLDSYDIFDERGSTAYTVEGRLAWGHKLVISDPLGEEVGVVREQALAFLPRFTISVRGKEVGEICKEFTFFRPSFRLHGLTGRFRETLWSGITGSQTEQVGLWRRCQKSCFIGRILIPWKLTGRKTRCMF